MLTGYCRYDSLVAFWILAFHPPLETLCHSKVPFRAADKMRVSQLARGTATKSLILVGKKIQNIDVPKG